VTGFTYSTKNQFIIAHELIDAGADMIIGHQPHVLQDFEYYVAKNGHKRLIYYSLGNWNTCIKSLYI
jgi:poly-gamma-glutamate synthesis protein (capsule biosynthesis protein)